MSRFNTPTVGTKTTNKAGGEAYSQSPELELVSILLTSFANDTFYEKAEDKFDRLKGLIKQVDPLFAAKACVFARKEFGMRSISHVLAGELSRSISGKEWARKFYTAVIKRPDDMTEIVSYLLANKQKLPNALKKGFAAAFDNFDAYALSKYRMEAKEVKLIDIVNLVHPRATERNSVALKALVEGTLKSTETWEAKLTEAGKTEGTQEQKTEAKKGAWKEMVEGDMPYMALLKNLRNILEADITLIPVVCEKLINREKIKKSLVLPFRYFTAIEELQQISGSREIVAALSKAAEISLDNIPNFPGKTLIAVDTSSSMNSGHGDNKSPERTARMFGAALYKKLDSDLLTFDNDARFISLNPADSVLSITQNIRFNGGSTNFISIFELVRNANKKYDRIIILSDMQAWVIPELSWGTSNPRRAFNNYKAATGANPKIYSFDLNNYGSMQFPESNVFCLAGFSEKIFSIMAMLEEDRNALIGKINSIEL
jgi:60 kDa SS-A/Ro ribonucleoprotein